jgi:hypothetical protein
MSKYESGSYHVITFDAVGGKLERKTGLTSYGEANRWGHMQLKGEKAHSFVSMRVVYNSVSNKGMW